MNQLYSVITKVSPSLIDLKNLYYHFLNQSVIDESQPLRFRIRFFEYYQDEADAECFQNERAAVSKAKRMGKRQRNSDTNTSDMATAVAVVDTTQDAAITTATSEDNGEVVTAEIVVPAAAETTVTATEDTANDEVMVTANEVVEMPITNNQGADYIL